MGQNQADTHVNHWNTEEPTVGVHLVRFGSRMLDPDQAPGFLLEWDRLLSDVGRAEVLILNFAQVEYVTASFLKCLITIYRELARKDAMLVVCQLQEQVREVFCVAGSRQPLADFNYVETEEQALMKARRFRRAQDDGEKLAGNAC